MGYHDSSLTGCLQLPPRLGLSDLLEGLEPFFRVSASQPVRENRTFYDTFEWTLWFSNQVLYHDGANTVCSALGEDWSGAVLAAEPSRNGPSPFPSSWPEGPLRKHLEKMLGVRALMPIAEIHASTRSVELMNADAKVVFRFDVVSLFGSGNLDTPYFSLCRPRPLRGYGHDAADALTQLRALGCTGIDIGPLEQFLIDSGRAPVPYTLRPVFGLSPEQPCREAVRNIVRRTLALARQQEQGIIDDIDTGFLHDYRICIRKIRSLITLMKGAYPPADSERLKKGWGDLARATNQLRDLDVYLLDRNDYLSLLPKSLQSGLGAFFAGITQERKQAQQELGAHLQSQSYLEKVEALAAFVTEPDRLPASEFSAHPIKPQASLRIYRRYRLIYRASRAVTPATPDDDIHQIRIECKKLRYMLEFFGELYDRDELDTLVQELKKVQNCLGAFNDYVMQQQSLLTYCQSHKETMSVEQALSVGGLISVLHLKQIEERARVEKALDIFSDAAIRRRFRRAFRETAAEAL